MSFSSAPSPSLSIQFDFGGVDTNLTRPEVLRGLGNRPVLLFFLSKHVSRHDSVAVLPLDLSSPTALASYTGRQVSLQSTDVRLGADAQYAVVGVTLYERFEIADMSGPEPRRVGYDRLRPVASGSVPLHRLLTNQRDREQFFLMPLMDHTAANEEGTNIPLHVISLKLRVRQIVAPTGLLRGAWSPQREEQERVMLAKIYQQHLDDYAQKRFRAWVTELEPMHVPTWLTDVGPNLPAAAYCLHVPAMASQREDSWPLLERSLTASATLEGWRVEDLVQVLRTQMQQSSGTFNPRFHRAMRTIQQACCLAANLCDYASDTSADPEQMDDERFVNVLTSGAGDCEDLAKMCFLVAWLLIMVSSNNPKGFDEFKSLDQGRQLLYWSSVALGTLVPFMMTTSASTPAMQQRQSGSDVDSSEPDSSEDAINHIAALLVPRFLAAEWIADAAPPATAVKQWLTIKAPLTLGPSTELGWERANSHVWVMEGTTFCEGAFLPLHLYFASESQALIKTAVGVRERVRLQLEETLVHPLQQLPVQNCAYNMHVDDVMSLKPMEFSSFYRYPDHLWSPVLCCWHDADATSGHAPYIAVDFHIRAAGEANRGTYGVRLQEVVARSHALALEPTYLLDASVYEIMLQRVAQQEPVLMSPPDLMAASNMTKGGASLPTLESVRKQYSEQLTPLLSLAAEYPLATPTSSPTQQSYDAHHEPYAYISYRVIHPMRIPTPTLEQSLRATLQAGTPVKALEIKLYPILSHLYLIELRLYLTEPALPAKGLLSIE